MRRTLVFLLAISEDYEVLRMSENGECLNRLMQKYAGDRSG